MARNEDVHTSTEATPMAGGISFPIKMVRPPECYCARRTVVRIEVTVGALVAILRPHIAFEWRALPIGSTYTNTAMPHALTWRFSTAKNRKILSGFDRVRMIRAYPN